MPNLQYDRVVLVDVKALLSGEAPSQVANVEGIRRVWQRLQDDLSTTEENPIDLSLSDLGTFIALEWGHWYEGYEDRGNGFAIQGDYHAEPIRESLSASEDAELLHEPSGELEVWRLTGYYSGNTSTVIFSDDRVYGVNRDFEDSSLFLVVHQCCIGG